MRRVFFMCLDASIAAVLLIPVFLLLNRYYIKNKTRSFFCFLFAIYLSGMFAVVGLPDIQYIRFDPHVNLIPFAYMFSDYRNSLLNVLLFIPMGFFLPLLWSAFRKMHKTILFGLCTSLLIELLQIFTFRATDVNDLMTNTAGTFLGWGMAKLVLRFSPGIRPSWKRSEVYVVCAAAFGVMFFLQPFLANFIFTFL